MYWYAPFSLVFYVCFVTTVRTIVCTLTVVKSYFYFEVFHAHCLSQFLFQYVQLNVINLQATNYRETVEYNAQQDSNWKSSETS